MTYTAAIAGGGFSGLMTLYHLVDIGPPESRFVIFEPRESLGRGIAYSTVHAGHVLNVRARAMSALPDQPHHFVDWLGRRYPGEYGPDDYAPRGIYRLYLDDLARLVFERAGEKNIHIEHYRAKLLDFEPAGRGWRLYADNEKTYEARACVLALGNLFAPPETRHPLFCADLWAFDFKTLSPSQGSVAIIGTGLTMVDAVIALRDGGYEGRIIAVSRGGRLPHVHEPGPMPSLPVDTEEPKAGSLLQLLTALRARARRCEASGLSWRAAIDNLRPHSRHLWEALDAREKKKFFAQLFTLWNIHRHRMAPEAAAFIARELDSGTLKVRAGGASLKPAAGHIEVRAGGETLLAAMVLDCRGPSYDVRKSGNALLDNLLRCSLIAPHDSGAGLALGPDLSVPGQQQKIFACGSLAIGVRFESVAVPELREQAREIALSLFARLENP